MEKQVVFQTERLIIRRWTLDDLPRLFEMYSHPDITRYMPDLHLEKIEEMEERMPRLLGTYAKYGPGYGAWAAERIDDQQVVGLVILKALPDRNNALTQDIEVGWHLARDSWNQGYATEMGQGALHHGFTTQGLTEIFAIALEENIRSIAVMKRLGMKEVGMTSAYYEGDPGMLYHLKRDDFLLEG